MILKFIFIVAGVVGIVTIFFVSWFWRALIIPMIILLFVDVIWGFLKKETKE